MTASQDPYQVIIGLEVHVQLKTTTKLFCRCKTVFGAEPNTQTCPVCLGLPGALPVMNQQAIELAIRAGIGLHSEIPEYTKWDRKNYFYPDLPKGYQVSQFDLPICNGGWVELPRDLSKQSVPRQIRLIRAHLEEDAGKSTHGESATASQRASSMIDLNRTGTPLLEIVSEPDIQSADEARDYLNELKRMLEAYDVSDCNMQEGSLRVDANVNIRVTKDDGAIAVTPIAEIKNLNSFRAVERAIRYEADRQYALWQSDGVEIGQRPKQTRGWDDNREETVLQRQKEESEEYRYFPDPDLPGLSISAHDVQKIRDSVSERPVERIHRYQSEFGLGYYDSDVLVSLGDAYARYFETLVANGVSAKRASSWVQQEVNRATKESEVAIQDFVVKATDLAKLLRAVEDNTLDTAKAREIFQQLVVAGETDTLGSLIDQAKHSSVDSESLVALCNQLLAENPDVVEKVKSGNAKAIGAIIGPAKKANPNVNPRQLQELALARIADM